MINKNSNTIEKIQNIIINNTDTKTVMEYLKLINCRTGEMNDKIIYKNDEESLSCAFGDNIIATFQAEKHGDYNVHDDYVVNQGYGNVKSYDNSSIRDYIESISAEMAEILAYDYIENENFHFEGIQLYEDLQNY